MFITAKDTGCRYRTAPNLLGRIMGLLPFGKVYQAEVKGGWFYIPDLGGYSRNDVVRVVPDPAIPKVPQIPVHVPQWGLGANERQDDCGLACLAGFIRAAGEYITVDSLKSRNPKGLTDAPELVQILGTHGLKAVVDYLSPDIPMSEVPAYSICLVNYTAVAPYSQDVRFTGPKAWHWYIWVRVRPDDPTMGEVIDPDYWGSRSKEGDHKRLPLAAIRKSFQPYGGNKVTTSVRVLGLPTQSPPPSSGEKLVVSTFKGGLHVEGADSNMILKFAQDSLGKLAVFTIISEVKLANALHRMGHTVVFRPFVDVEHTYSTNWLNKTVNGQVVPVTEEEARQKGRDFYWNCKEHAMWHEKDGGIDAGITLNLITEKGYHIRDGAFTLGLMEASASDPAGHRLGVFCDSYSTPDYPEWATRIEAMREVKRQGHFWMPHTYGLDDPDFADLGGRHVKILDALPVDCRPYVIFKECGISDGNTTDPDAIKKMMPYFHWLSVNKYAELIIGACAFTAGRYPENTSNDPNALFCSLDAQLPYYIEQMRLEPNPPMAVVYLPLLGAGAAPAPIPQPLPQPIPVPAPKPKPSTWSIPFPATSRGIHGNAGGWSPDATELGIIQHNKIETAFLVAYEQNQAQWIIPSLRNAGVKNFVLRAEWRGSWECSAFINGSLGLIREYVKALGSSDGLMIQLHNEPNLVDEGWASAWKDGAEFASWWLFVADAYRKAFPGVRLGFPALSPGDSQAGARLSEATFAKQAAPAIAQADWVGVHYYWLKQDGGDIAPPVTLWRTLYGSKPLLGTEVGPANETLVDAVAVRKAYEVFGTSNIPICSWLLSSPKGYDNASWLKNNVSL